MGAKAPQRKITLAPGRSAGDMDRFQRAKRDILTHILHVHAETAGQKDMRDQRQAGTTSSKVWNSMAVNESWSGLLTTFS